MKMTIKGKNFIMQIVGIVTKIELFFFTIEENLQLLSSNNDWYMNGTFDATQTISNSSTQFI